MKRKNYFKHTIATLALAGVVFFSSAPSAKADLLSDLGGVLRTVLDIVLPPSPPPPVITTSSSFRTDARPTHQGLNSPAAASMADGD